jgi:predicted nucleic acid-binding Zn ribbon protein
VSDVADLRRRRDPVRLADVLASLLDGKGVGSKLRQGMAVAVWPEVVGSQLANVAKATVCRDGCLYVEVAGSVWMQELAFLQSELIARLNKRIGRRTVRKLVLKPKRAGAAW